MIERTFQHISKESLDEADQQSFLESLGWSKSTTWQELLQSRRILMISEAGAGKTYECREQARLLSESGQPAFFVELATLARDSMRDSLTTEEEQQLDTWLFSQSETATFFLDSVDELNLSLGSFEHALKRFRKTICDQLHRARIVITTRPIPLDEQLVRRVLPVPPTVASKANGETFAKIAMQNIGGKHGAEDKAATASDWQIVGLMPLSDEQIIEFSRLQGVDEPAQLLIDLEQRNAQEFARRPQDLIELCADWRDQRRIRTHSDQVATNIRIKLKPSEDRPEPAELSVEKAEQGARRIALAMQLTRLTNIKHNAASDHLTDDSALDPSTILADWNQNERRALLERPLFGFASYGRVRFHHRSVAEYLAAERLLELFLSGQMPLSSLKRLLFAETKGVTIVRPSKRPIAAWVALRAKEIFELLRDHEPTILLNEGDPESLTPIQRSQALEAYATRYGSGGWRGLTVPDIQIHRFASPDLAKTITGIWGSDVENPEVRKVLLDIIGAGSITECSDILYHVACDPESSPMERMVALDGLLTSDHARTLDIASDIANADPNWSERVSRSAVIRLFPEHMSIEQLCQALGRLKFGKRSVDGLTWELPRKIAASEFDLPKLEALRDGLTGVISPSLAWSKEWPHFESEHQSLCHALAATCVLGLKISRKLEWLQASVLALRLHTSDQRSEGEIKTLRELVLSLPAEDNSRLFWAADALVRSLHEIDDPWMRLAEVTMHDSATELKADRDIEWIKAALSDPSLDQSDRALLLEAALRMPSDRDAWKRKQHAKELESLVADVPDLVVRIKEWIKPTPDMQKIQEMERKHAERKEQQEREKENDYASWRKFWQEVVDHPENVFSTRRREATAWNLWRAMSPEGDNSRKSGWNRTFIEEQFSRKIADQLRHTLMSIWRNDHPTLASERPEQERNVYQVRWQLGLAAIYAETEDPEWAIKLDEHEAKLAIRFALVEPGSLPSWMEALVEQHPNAVEEILGKELSWELNQAPGPHGISNVLQAIEHSPQSVARVFLTRLQLWLDAKNDYLEKRGDIAAFAQRVQRVCRMILTHGNEEELSRLLETTQAHLEIKLPTELRQVWLPILMNLDPGLGVAALERQFESIEPGEWTEAVEWLANLFGDHHNTIDLNNGHFTPDLLLKLVRLAYKHVRTKDDVSHDGGYTPDMRDHAELARSNIVRALLNVTGETGLAAKLEMADDPLCAHFRDRILAVADESWAQEIDSDVLNETQAAALDRRGETPVTTNESMFVVMKDRLSDLSELLLHDDSPREAWAAVSNEKVMRRQISRELKNSAKGIYRVDQEAVTADEKETDIRLRSTESQYEAVIELKLADERSARDLRDTIKIQLVNKYMASNDCRSGALLVTLAKDRRWKHPETGKRIGPDKLIALLQTEAERVERYLSGAVSLHVEFLDLRPRLPLEKNS
ncbi:MAG: hypothetical protein ABJQ08_06490 [Paracoccaceae bacterium]